MSLPPLGRNLWVALLVLPLIHTATGASEVQKADAVLIVKSEKRLYLLDEGDAFASFHVTFGGNPKGHKERQGDGNAGADANHNQAGDKNLNCAPIDGRMF